jgi:hypothetical protein
MKIKEKLKVICNYYVKNRQVGHTRAVIRGAQNTDNVVIVSTNESTANSLRGIVNSPMVGVCSLSDSDLSNLGAGKALVFDNGAIFALLREAVTEIERLEGLNTTPPVNLETVVKDVTNDVSSLVKRFKDGIDNIINLAGPQADLYMMGMYNAAESIHATFDKRTPKFKTK